MLKKILSAALALCMVFGTAAVLPEGAVELGSEIVASAAGVLTYDNYEYKVLDDGTIEITGYFISDDDYSDKNLTVPSTINGKKVTRIGDKAFNRCGSLISIIIPNGVTSIGYDAFCECRCLKSITIPNTVHSIEAYAFFYCISLESITIPDGVTGIAHRAFNSCERLTSIKLPDTIRYVSDNAFQGCPLYDNQTGPVKYIDNIAVGCDENITDLEFKEGTRGITLNGYFSNLKSVKLPDSVKFIGECSFEQSPKLADVKLGSGLIDIGVRAFYVCPSLRSLTIPKSVKYVRNFSLGYSLICPFGIHEKYDGFRIICYNGSAAHKYAKDNGINYQLIDAQSISKATVSGLKNKYYTGKAIKQTPVVKLSGKTLKSGTDYTVSYKNNKAVGTATVTITGKGAYTGTVSKTFKICPKKTTLKTAKSPKTKQLKVTYSKVAGVTGYQVTYSTSSKFTKATTKSVNVKGTSKTISKLTKGKTYYVKVRTYKTVGKTKFYSGYSAVKKVKIK